MRDLPFDINDKIKQDLQTIGNNADPKMQVVVARAKSSIQDSSYFTVENIRTKAGLTDISVATRRQKSYGPPDGLFAIHLDNGVAKVLERAYPDRLNLKWQERFQLGAAKAVAITFNGQWRRYRKFWQLVTEEHPYIFWVDISGSLYVQKWNDTDTKFLLANNVNKIKAVRGWKNVNFTHKDDGVIAGYIKTDGLLYYRNLTSVLGNLDWENERKIEEFVGTSVNLNMFLTNDYRTAFMVEDTMGSIHWILTERNWAGMAIAPEKFAIRAKAQIVLEHVKYIKQWHTDKFTIHAIADIKQLFARTDNSITEVENIPILMINEELEEYEDWGFKIRLKFKYFSIDPPTIKLLDITTLSEYATTMIEINPGYEYELLIDNNLLEYGFNTASGNLMVNVTNFKNPAGFDYEVINKEFTPINLKAPIVPIPEIEVIWNE